MTININGKWMTVGTLSEASRRWCGYRDDTGLGVSECCRGCGDVRDGSQKIATVSYNGRVWGLDGQEIK